MSYRHHVTDMLAHPRSATTRPTPTEFLASLNREPWMRNAACTGADPEAWFGQSSSDKTKAALLICHRVCQVRAECLAYALRHNLRGVWGGTTTNQRLALQAKRDRA